MTPPIAGARCSVEDALSSAALAVLLRALLRQQVLVVSSRSQIAVEMAMIPTILIGAVSKCRMNTVLAIRHSAGKWATQTTLATLLTSTCRTFTGRSRMIWAGTTSRSPLRRFPAASGQAPPTWNAKDVNERLALRLTAVEFIRLTEELLDIAMQVEMSPCQVGSVFHPLRLGGGRCLLRTIRIPAAILVWREREREVQG
mmetsp:Transcript_102743/g.182533  ORF Transcript_102743/g.182533 Transcript_102743/m.182533 type:complete len:200 (+) Transcript_102743:457-1056(+)